MRLGRRPVRLVGCALEDDVERVTGMGEGSVEAVRRDVDEALQLLGVPIMEREPSTATSETSEPSRQISTPPPPSRGSGGLRRQEAFQRLPPQRPAQALQVVGRGCEREGHGYRPLAS